jgi:hypothetical protein
MAIKYTKCPKYIPNVHKIFQHLSLQDTPKLVNMNAARTNVRTYAKTFHLRRRLKKGSVAVIYLFKPRNFRHDRELYAFLQ